MPWKQRVFELSNLKIQVEPLRRGMRTVATCELHTVDLNWNLITDWNRQLVDEWALQLSISNLQSRAETIVSES